MIRFKPFDPLFFRDGKPFTMGEDSWAASLFPPPPSVFYGALRAVWFTQHDSQLSKVGTPEDPTTSLNVTGIFLSKGEQIFVPLPLDCVSDKSKKGIESAFLLGLRPAPPASSSPTPMLLRPKESSTLVEVLSNCWFDSISLEEYLEGQRKEFYYTTLDNFIEPEPRVGVAIDRTRGTVKEEYLYRIGMNRMKSTSFLVDYQGLNLSTQGLGKLGGEGRAVSFDHIQFYHPAPPKLDGDVFKLYFLTPAVFSNGWLPGWIDEKTLRGTYNNLRLELVSAALGNPISIGGYDIRTGPKSMRRVVPAGSIYYFKILEGCLGDVSKLHGKALSDYADDAKQGSGICYVGRVTV